MSAPEMLRIMPREMRMMSERILSLTALPKGFAMMAVDIVMYSQAMGLGGFALLEKRLETLKDADVSRLSLAHDGATLDGGDQHAWMVVPSLLDLLGLAATEGAVAHLDVTNVVDPEELKLAVGLGARMGLRVTVTGSAATATSVAPQDPVLDQIMQQGCAVPAALWWRIYDCAQTALMPESAVSRRHAGPVIVTEDGRLIGRTDNDDDTDVSFIGSDGSQSVQGERT